MKHDTIGRVLDATDYEKLTSYVNCNTNDCPDFIKKKIEEKIKKLTEGMDILQSCHSQIEKNAEDS